MGFPVLSPPDFHYCLCIHYLNEDIYWYIQSQAAKEFESELKKDGEPSEDPEGEKITAVSEEAKQEVKVPSTKESS